MNKIFELNKIYLKYKDPEVLRMAKMSLSYIEECMLEKHFPNRSVKESVDAKPVANSKQKEYKKKAWKLTNEKNISSLADIDKRSFKHFHLDHKISIFYGFKNDIPVEHIADISNLRIISANENLNKGAKCFIDDDNRWILS